MGEQFKIFLIIFHSRPPSLVRILESLYHKFAFFCNTLLRYKNFTLFYKNLSIAWLWILHKVAIINLVREKKLVLIFTVYINSNENAEIS